MWWEWGDLPGWTRSAGQTGPGCTGPTVCTLQGWKASWLQPSAQHLCTPSRAPWLLARLSGHCIWGSSVQIQCPRDVLGFAATRLQNWATHIWKSHTNDLVCCFLLFFISCPDKISDCKIFELMKKTPAGVCLFGCHCNYHNQKNVL